MKAVITVALGVFFVTGMWSQESEDFLRYKNKYPEARYVRLQEIKEVDIDLNSDNISISQGFLEESMYLDDGATVNSKESLNFSSFFEMESIEASAFNFERGKYREESVDTFTEKDDVGNSFYDDVKTINFVYKNLKKGSKTKIAYTENVKDPRFLSPFYFGSFYPIENSSVELKVDKDIDIKFLEFNTEGLDLQFEKEERRNENIYRWTVKNVEEYDYESDAPSFKTMVPHIIPIINSYTVNGNKVAVLNDVSDLYNWYASLVKNINKEESSAELKTTVQTLTAGLDSDLEKVKAIYYWTQENIKYIAFEYALGGFIPREANDVFNKKYGDCKDNSSILQEMLRIAGLKGDLTWIGTRDIPYTYNEVPTPLVDNHMILSYTEAGTTYYLDATGRFTPIDLPTSFIQGKEALVGNGPDSFTIQTVPIVPASRNELSENTTLYLEGDVIKGSAKASLTGYIKSRVFNRLEGIDSKAVEAQFYKDSFEKGNNKFLIETYEEINKYSYEKPFEVDYTFTIENHARKLGDEVYINLNLNKIASAFTVEEDRKLPLESDFKKQFVYRNTFTIPDGYQVSYLPESAKGANDNMSFEVLYEQNQNTITYTHTLTADFMLLDLAAQKELNALIDQVDKAYNEVIVLTKTTP